MTSGYLLLPLRSEAQVRAAREAAEAEELAADLADPIPDIDDSEKFLRLRDPFLHRDCYREDWS